MQQQNKTREQRRAAHALRMAQKKAMRERARSALDQHLQETNTAVAGLRDSIRTAVRRQRPHASAAELHAEAKERLNEVLRATAAGGEFRTADGKVFTATPLREVFDEIAPDGRGVSVEEMHAALLQRARDDIRERMPGATPEKVEEMVAEESDKLRLNLMNIAAAEQGISPAAAWIDHDEATKKEGRERAERLKPRARELACGPAMRGLSPNIVDALVKNGAGLDDVEYVLVYPAPTKSPPGWHGDVDFGRPLVPLPGAIGTKVDNPAQSPEDAERFALDLLIGIAAFDAARVDPRHPLHPRAQHRVQELDMFADVEDRMVVDFPAWESPDFDAYRIGLRARIIERDDFLRCAEEVFRGPGDSPQAQEIGLAFVRHCRDNPSWLAQLQEEARQRRLWERLEPAASREEAPGGEAGGEPPASPEAVAGAAELIAGDLLEQFRADIRAAQPVLGEQAVDAMVRTMLRTVRGDKAATAMFLANMRTNFPTLPRGVDTQQFCLMLTDAALRQLDRTAKGGDAA